MLILHTRQNDEYIGFKMILTYNYFFYGSPFSFRVVKMLQCLRVVSDRKSNLVKCS